MPATIFCTFQKVCKYQHFLPSTRPKCCNLQCFFFCFAFKNTGICSVLCSSGQKSIGIYSIFCFLASLPQETSERKNAVIYSISSVWKRQTLSKKALRWANLGAFWGSCWASLSHLEPQNRKRAKATKCCKTQYILGSAARAGPVPLTSFGGGGPTAMPRPVGARGPLAGFKGLRPTAGQGPT